MTDDLNRYYKLLRKDLICSKLSKDRFIDETNKIVNDFIESKPEASFDDIEELLGEPEALAETCLQALEPKEVQFYYKKRLFLRRLRTISLAFITILLCFLIYYIGHTRMNVNITEEKTIIIYED